MLSRAATKITLTTEDIAAFEARQNAREAMKRQELEESQQSSQDTMENDADHKSATQTRAARAKTAREQRIGVGPS